MSGSEVITVESLRGRYGNPLDELKVRESKSYFNHLFAAVPPSEGVTSLWFNTDTSANAAVNRDGPDAVCHCDAATQQHAEVATTERTNYTPGTSAVSGFAVHTEQQPVGEQDVWCGPTNEENGYILGSHGAAATGATEQTLYVGKDKAGTRTKVEKPDWNRDTLDGSGPNERNPSGVKLSDLGEGVIGRIDPSLYYGHGEMTVAANVKVTEEELPETNFNFPGSKHIELHTFTEEGDTMVEQPNVPITTRAETNGTATQAIDFHVTAVHYERNAQEADTRENGIRRAGVDVDAAWEPLISLRKRPDWEQVNSRPILMTVQTDTDLTLDLELGTGLNGASFALPVHTSSSEAALEYDISATGFAATGERRWVGQVTGGQGGQKGSGTGRIQFNIPSDRNLTLAAKADADNASVTATMLAGSEF